MSAGETYVCLEKSALVEAMTLLRDDPELQYDYFSETPGVDYSAWEHERDLPNRFEVVYNLMSVTHSSRIFIKVGVDDGASGAHSERRVLGCRVPGEGSRRSVRHPLRWQRADGRRAVSSAG